MVLGHLWFQTYFSQYQTQIQYARDCLEQTCFKPILVNIKPVSVFIIVMVSILEFQTYFSQYQTISGSFDVLHEDKFQTYFSQYQTHVFSTKLLDREYRFKPILVNIKLLCHLVEISGHRCFKPILVNIKPV